MGTLSILFGAILLGFGLMLFLMAIPLLRGSVGRNNYYGFRYARAYASTTPGEASIATACGSR